MAKLTPAEYADKQVARTQAGSPAYTQGVQRVTSSPTSAAAGAVTKWQSKVNDPATAAKFTRNLNRVSLDEWKAAAVNKGAPRLASGIAAAKPKVEAFAAEYLPFLDAGVAKVKAMPSTSLEDNINRAVAMMRYNATFRRRT